MNKKVIIAGSRSFEDYQLLEQTLTQLFPEEVDIVSGTAMGADKLGEAYAKKYALEVHRYPADWDGLGKRAGYVRNKQMAEVSDALVAFWDGKSSGTRHMIELALDYGLDVFVIQF